MMSDLPHILSDVPDIGTHESHCEHIWRTHEVCMLCFDEKPHLLSPEILGERSSGWFAVRNDFLMAYPRCSACGKTSDLEVHHVFPFHTHPELELDKTNLVTLCEYHHLIVGHRGNWKNINPNVRKDCLKLWRIYKTLREFNKSI